VALVSLYYGLEFLFDGCKVPFNVLKNPASIPDYFATISRRDGLQLIPDERFVDIYGGSNPDKAIEWFKINTANYPGSFNAWSRLATAYEAKGEKLLAIASFEKALALNPDDRNAAERLRRLKPAKNPTGSLTNAIYKVINCASGKALAVCADSTTNLAAIIQAAYDGHQQWAFTNLATAGIR